MTTALQYHGRPLTAEPINASHEHLAQQVARGHTVVANLEPGDATHYCLVITPAWAPHVAEHLGRFGVPANISTEYLLVTYLRSTNSDTFFIRANPGPYDFERVQNAWTREFFAWWFTGFWDAIQAARP